MLLYYYIFMIFWLLLV